ncbi:FAD-binding oxidoreductase [Aspergillus affinis]|uniref:FAD-binding oxidoreductase n=1 Tax=Aspergillus affinis TaxID=1070780 RepID=UPI0022FF331C|nr:FAD-binding domain-containing protein [Aspergillus affinis]KAI9043863.1 FAD-binding domain-containing protein [Aspergillus affinis]
MLSAEAANIQDGVTVDLRPLHQATVSDDRLTVRIGSGASWLQVYQILDPLHLTVAGGRDASIGAGGFLTSGGISALSPAVGWGCDEMLEYEIVLANGEITVVTEPYHPDLFVAFKGGSNNFGVVTHFSMRAHPYRQIWGGFTAYASDEIPRQIQAYSDFMESKTLLKNIDAYAIYTSLRSYLGANNKVLKGVQSIKTGFALLLSPSETLAALEAQKEIISIFFDTC